VRGRGCTLVMAISCKFAARQHDSRANVDMQAHRGAIPCSFGGAIIAWGVGIIQPLVVQVRVLMLVLSFTWSTIEYSVQTTLSEIGSKMATGSCSVSFCSLHLRSKTGKQSLVTSGGQSLHQPRACVCMYTLAHIGLGA
jgi:hypothetical protein